MPKYGAGSISDLATEINTGYFQWYASIDSNQDPHRRFWPNYNSGSPTSITVNVSELQPDEQALATQAYKMWEAVANVHFVPTTGAADITYTDVDDGNGAITYTNTFWDGLTNHLLLTSATVHMPRTWSGGPAAGINSYFFQSMVHETGHALGLGHSGNYNKGNVDQYYNTDSTLYANDTWQWSIMSYNDQAEYGSATNDNVITPQMADIFAVQDTYGAATTRTDNTTYGFNSTAGSLYDFASYSSAPAFTIYDSGGTDTLDASLYSQPQEIDLTPGNWSSIGGYTDNIAIYTGVVIENAVGGSGNDGIIGNDANNILYGGAGNDQLDGGLGVDTFYGGLGDDLFEVRNAADVIIENPGEGTDRYDSYVSIDALPANVENLVLYGTTDLYAIANDLPNVISGSLGSNGLYGEGGNDQIYGYSGDDWIDGGAGNDTMVGGPGNDTYQVDSALDVVVEKPGEGTDQVDSYLSYTLGANVENLVLYGTVTLNGTGNGLANVLGGNLGNNFLQGLAGNDTIYGYDGGDTLDGGTGADVMIGGTGDDTYYVDNAGDSVRENAGEGVDTVYASVGYTLTAGSEIEFLRANAGATGLSLTGNTLSNSLFGGTGNDTLNGGAGNDTLTGGAGNDSLNGGAGADVLVGGTGNDTFAVDNAGDVVKENVGEGTDTVYASVSYTLTANSEIEFLRANAGATGLSLTGNTLNNSLLGGTGNDTLNGGAGNDTLTGGAGNDSLNGGAGADVLVGGTGNDTFVVDNAGDTVTENVGEGTDTVQTTLLSGTLGANVENLTFIGSGNFTGTGNTLNNVITGGAGGDKLNGGAGNDTLSGGAGNDTLTGGTGQDSFLFSKALNALTNVDNIPDFSVADDTILLSHLVFTAAGPIGTLAAGAFFTGSAAGAGTNRIIYNKSSGALSYDSDGTGAAASVQFAHVTAGLALTNADFHVV
jgi:Ca2+-binding RTX toxin-like protein